MFPTRRTSMRSSSVILAVLTSVTFSPARAQSLYALSILMSRLEATG